MLDHGVGQHVDHLITVNPAANLDRQALPRVLVDQLQESYHPSVMHVGTHEVIGPDVIRPLRPQPYAGAVIEPQMTAWLLLLRNLQPLAAPDPLHAILAYVPAGFLQLDGDASVSIPAIFTGLCDDGPGQRVFVVPGSEASPHDVLKDLLIQTQLGHQTLEFTVLLFQFLQAFGLVHLETAVLLASAVVSLLSDAHFPACYRVRFPVCYRYFNLPQNIHNLLRRVLPGLRHSTLLPYQFVSLPLVQNLPDTPIRTVARNDGNGPRSIPYGTCARARSVPEFRRSSLPSN